MGYLRECTKCGKSIILSKGLFGKFRMKRPALKKKGKRFTCQACGETVKRVDVYTGKLKAFVRKVVGDPGSAADLMMKTAVNRQETERLKGKKDETGKRNVFGWVLTALIIGIMVTILLIVWLR